MLDFIGTMATSALMVLVVAALTVALKMSNPGKLTFAMIGGLWIGFAAASAQAGWIEIGKPFPLIRTLGCRGRLALRLSGNFHGGGFHRDEGAPAGGAVEGDLALDGGEDRMILANADIAAGMIFGAALAQDDIARHDDRAAEFLHAEALAGAVAPVAGTAACFLMCHDSAP